VALTLQISDELLAASGLPASDWEFEARKELALAFYARGLFSIGKAAELAAATRMEFERWVAERKIERPFSEVDLARELEWVKSE